MNNSTLETIKIIFLLGFTLHNFEEAIWLPKWSKYAGKYQKPVESNHFIFAVFVITIFGYFVTVLNLLAGETNYIILYTYLGFIGMMGLNSIFPHLIATIVIKKYSPGLMTGLLLNLPVSVILLFHYINNGINFYYLFIAIILVGGLLSFSLKYLFRLGKMLIQFPD
ncbi:HXXEE domain-containing protein [candidate division KSB1 bacterium]|nr:HXXEE domain-containing protein [candidate division KSB1 bacterium]